MRTEIAGVCTGCGGRFADAQGPVHPYMLASAGCWNAYGDLLAREYSDADLFSRVHRLSVDAYALQHPGDPADGRARQSVILHYCSLFLIFENGCTHKDATRALQALTGQLSGQLSGLLSGQLSCRVPTFSITLGDVLPQLDEDHEGVVRTWAAHSYEVWAGLKPEARRLTSGL